MQISRLSASEASVVLPSLVDLLLDTVNGGASVGFVPPLSEETARSFWDETIREVEQGERKLLVASEGDGIVGSVQLVLATKQNALHRAEVQKLMVHSNHRNRGIAKALLEAVELVANEFGRTLLVLDTEQASPAESLYAKVGYMRSGVIPEYARSAAGHMISTVVFYKLL